MQVKEAKLLSLSRRLTAENQAILLTLVRQAYAEESSAGTSRGIGAPPKSRTSIQKPQDFSCGNKAQGAKNA